MNKAKAKTVKQLLAEELNTEFEKLKGLTPGTDEHKAVLEAFTKTCDRAIEMEKIKVEKRNANKRLVVDILSDVLKNTVAIGGTALTILGFMWAAKNSWEFEKEGTVTNMPGRLSLSTLLSMKK